MPTAELDRETVVIPYRDAGGRPQELRVSGATARALHAIWRGARREEEKWRERHVTFTDLGLDAGRVAAPAPVVAAAKGDDGHPWEGPRLAYPLLLGESPTWSGFASLWILGADGLYGCRFCGHYRRLPDCAYCLNCDRAGREYLIPSATEADVRKRARRKAHRAGRLKGGVGGKG